MKRNPLPGSVLLGIVYLLVAGSISRGNHVMAQDQQTPEVPPVAGSNANSGSASIADSGCPGCAERRIICVFVTPAPIEPSSATASSTVTRGVIPNLPIGGRNFQGYIMLAPGTVSPGPAGPASRAPVNISTNGQPPASNGFTIDGVDGNFGIAPGGESPGASACGSALALTATGATSAIAAVNTTYEISLRNYGFTADSGRGSGLQTGIVTKSGTNAFHGAAFYSFNHEALDANDWFANSLGLAKPRHRLSEFGASVGGPIKRDRLLFFAAYEGLRLRQPVVAITDVPSRTSRTSAPPNVQPLLSLYPLPNRPERADGFAESASSFANAGRHDVGSLRFNGRLSPQLSLSASVHVADSTADERGAGGFSLNTLNHLANRAQTITGTASYDPTPTVTVDLKANYSRFTSRSSYQLDTFGGALLPSLAVFTPPALTADALVSADLNAKSTQLRSGSDVTSTQRQINVLGSLSKLVHSHALKLGVDYRRVFPIVGLRGVEHSALFDGVTQALTGDAARVNFLTRSRSQRPVFSQFSAFLQDDWRVSQSLTISYGLRWEVSPAPHSSDQKTALAVNQVADVARLAVAPPGTALWETTYGNFAPHVAVAYAPKSDYTWVIRSSFGFRYDLANAAVGDAYASSYPFLNGQSQFNVPFSFAAPTPLNANAVTVPFSAFDPHLRLPYLIEWSASVQRDIAREQTIQAAYVGNAGKRLLLTNTLLNQNPDFEFLRLTTNGASSTYHALQLQFDRRLSRRLGAMVSYTWAKAVDNASEDSAARALFRSVDAQLERGPSDFDVRHTLSGFVSFEVPAAFASGFGKVLTRSWSLDSIFNVRSAAPVNVVYGLPTTFGLLYVRPDSIPGAPFYVNDVNAAGGRRLNPAAFDVPQDLRQGTLGRTAVRGFALSQVNLALRRHFSFTDAVQLTLSAEAANVFNHPNFAAPSGNDASLGTRFAPAALSSNPTFGQSYTNAARSTWGIAGSTFAANYYPGGARAVRLSAKLEF